MDIRVTTRLDGKTQYKAVLRPPVQYYQDKLQEFFFELNSKYGDTHKFRKKNIKTLRDERYNVVGFTYVV